MDKLKESRLKNHEPKTHHITPANCSLLAISVAGNTTRDMHRLIPHLKKNGQSLQ